MKIPMTPLLLVVMLGASCLLAAEPIGHVIALQGKATATGGGGARKALAMKSPVFLNDTVATEAAAKLQIMFVDDSLIALGENSSMILDKYVYDPENKRRNSSSSRFLKGVFRVITGKITDANPEGFKVKTSRATIGIRGCEVGFRLDEKQDRFYIRQLPDGRRIVFFGPDGRGRPLLEVRRDGVLVVIGDDGELLKMKVTQKDALLLLQQTTPVIRPNDAGAESGRPWAWQPGLPRLRLRTESAERAPSPGAPPLKPLGPGIVPTSGPSRPGHSGPGSTFVERGRGTDWAWGYWMNGDILESLELRPGAVLSAEDFQAIASAETAMLYGDGDAAAIVEHAGTRRLLEGSCSVSVGLGANSVWYGSVGIGNDVGDSLSFVMNGSYASDGKITAAVPASGEVSPFYLNVNGITFDRSTLTSQDIRALLFGSGSGDYPVTGTGGWFDFINDNGSQIAVTKGLFATDLMSDQYNGTEY